MKHIKKFENFSPNEVEKTNEEILGLFKSSDSKGFAIATQGHNFAMYVQQALDPRAGRTGKPLKRSFGDMDLSDLTKDDFMRFAKLMKKLNFDYKAIKGAVKADEKLEKIMDYICARGYQSASFTSTNTGTRTFGSGEGAVDRYDVNTNLDPEKEIENIKERKPEVEKQPELVKKAVKPESKLESKRNK